MRLGLILGRHHTLVLKLNRSSFAYLCVLLRELCGSAFVYRKGRKGFAKGRKEKVITSETEL